MTQKKSNAVNNNVSVVAMRKVRPVSATAKEGKNVIQSRLKEQTSIHHHLAVQTTASVLMNSVVKRIKEQAIAKLGEQSRPRAQVSCLPRPCLYG